MPNKPKHTTPRKKLRPRVALWADDVENQMLEEIVPVLGYKEKAPCMRHLIREKHAQLFPKKG